MPIEYALETRQVLPFQSKPTRVELSAKGDDLLIQCEDGSLWYHNGPEGLVWSGAGSSSPTRAALDETRRHVLEYRSEVVHAFDSRGTSLWGYHAPTTNVQALFLNGHQVVVTVDDKSILNLGKGGPQARAEWILTAGARVSSVGLNRMATALVAGTDREIQCFPLNGAEGQAWSHPVDSPILHVMVGDKHVVGTDAAGNVYYLSLDSGRLLTCFHSQEEQIASLAISGTGGYVAMAGKASVMLLQLRVGNVLIRPEHPKRNEMQARLKSLEVNQIQKLYLSAAGDCLLIETDKTFLCYLYNGTAEWSCDKVDLFRYTLSTPAAFETELMRRIQKENPAREKLASRVQELAIQLNPPLSPEIVQQTVRRVSERAAGPNIQEVEERIVRQVQSQGIMTEMLELQVRYWVAQVQPDLAPDEEEALVQRLVTRLKPPEEVQIVEQIKQEFIDYVRIKGQSLTKDAQARVNTTVKGEPIDLVFNGAGYFFVPTVGIQILERVNRLARAAPSASFYIIAFDASAESVQQVKRIKNAVLYRLRDSVKTAGIGLPTDFETFFQTTHGRMFQFG